MGRERETITGSLTNETCVVQGQGPSGPPVHILTTYAGEQKVKHVEDVLTPGFFSLKKCGKFLPLNPFSVQTRTEKRVPGSVNVYYPAYDSTNTGTWWRWHPPSIEPPDPDPAMIDAAVLAAAANSASAEWDVLTFMAELRSTAATLHSIGSLFNRRTGELARRARRFRKNPYKAFRELWLEARYGIRPLLYDFRSAVLALKALQGELEMVVGRGSETQSNPDEADSGHQPYVFDFNIHTRERVRSEIRYRGFAASRFETALNTAIQVDPLVTAWELLSYSFVVDWFINIGAYVQTIRPQLSGDYLGLSASIKTTNEYEQTVSYIGIPAHGANGDWTNTKTVISLERYHRYPTTVPLPPVLPDLSIPKVVDLVTLFVGGRNRVHKTLAI